eukprot:GEMP01001561.1.p1 GENE.GEMP01001561.1~~GEMP01001561.1.p1  ORF type:complete len:1598 (+),score=333.10 GEMP01001561.1:262-5055(+)
MHNIISATLICAFFAPGGAKLQVRATTSCHAVACPKGTTHRLGAELRHCVGSRCEEDLCCESDGALLLRCQDGDHRQPHECQCGETAPFARCLSSQVCRPAKFGKCETGEFEEYVKFVADRAVFDGERDEADDIAESTGVSPRRIVLVVEAEQAGAEAAKVPTTTSNNENIKNVPILRSLEREAQEPATEEGALAGFAENTVETQESLGFFRVLQDVDATSVTSRGSLVSRRRALFDSTTIDYAPSATTLNSGTFIVMLSHLFQYMQQPADTRPLSTFDTASRVQTYFNLGRKTAFVAADVANFVILVKMGLAQSKGQFASEFLQGFTTKIDVASTKLTYVTALANIGFDIYELTQATTEMERNTAITQLTFDSAFLALQAGASVSNMLGASIAAGVFNALAIPLVGISIGVGALVVAFTGIAAQAAQVGFYFGTLKEGLTNGVYRDDGTNETRQGVTYTPKPFAVVKEINFQTRTLALGSLYLSKSTHGSTGSSKMNYFFWIGDLPKCKIYRNFYNFDPTSNWMSDVFDLRERMESNGCPTCAPTQQLPASMYQGDFGAPFVLVLPSSPQSIIAYEYFILPGATLRGDFGFDVMRDLEGDDFDFDFYIFPSEYIILRMNQFFLDTNVNVVMDDTDRILVTPIHEEESKTNAWNKLYYHIVGHTGLTTIVLQYGVNFFLESTTRDAVSFVLDSTLLADDPPWNLTTSGTTLHMGAMWVDYSALPVESNVWIRGKNGLSKLNITERTILTESIVLSPNSTLSLDDVKLNLDALSRANSVAVRFVPVVWRDDAGRRNHTDGGHTTEKRAVWYDTAEGMFIYTSGATPSDTDLLDVQNRQFGCFASSSQCRVWCTNLDTHQVVFETISLCDSESEFKLGSFSFVGDKRALLEVNRVHRSSTGNTSLHYLFLLSTDGCFFVSIREFVPRPLAVQGIKAALDTYKSFVSSASNKHSPAIIGDNTEHAILSTHEAHWVAYDSLVLKPNATAPLYDQRTWYCASTNTTIHLRAGHGTHPPLESLTFMPLSLTAHTTARRRLTRASTKEKRSDVLFHDAASAQVFWYERKDSPHKGTGGEREQSGTLVVFRRDITNVTFAGSAWFGVTTNGSVVQFVSTNDTQIVGYLEEEVVTKNGEKQIAPHWWESRASEDKTVEGMVPLYQMDSGKILPTRAWYVPAHDVYVIIDQHFNENGTVNCVGITENKADALLVGGNGTMWVVPVSRASDIEVADEGALRLKKPLTLKEWGPSKSQFFDHGERIIRAGWTAGGITLKTNSGLMIQGRNLTRTSTEFILRGLHVHGDDREDDENSVRTAYNRGVSLGVRMPEEDFVPTWGKSARGYLFNVGRQVRFLRPSHQGVPIGVNDIENIMVFFDAISSVFWSNNTRVNLTFDSAVRFGGVLGATSSSNSVHIPKLKGVKKIVIFLNNGVSEVAVHQSHDELTEFHMDTRSMTEYNTPIRVFVPWDAQGYKTHHEFGADIDATAECVVEMGGRRTLRWKGLRHHRMILSFAKDPDVIKYLVLAPPPHLSLRQSSSPSLPAAVTNAEMFPRRVAFLSHQPSLSTGAIVAIVLSALVVTALVVAIICGYRTCWKGQGETPTPPEAV